MKRHLIRRLSLLAACIFLTQAAGLALAADPVPNTPTEKEKADGWKLLFDGKTIDCWRNFRSDKIGDGWKVIDGAIVRAADGAGDIITKDQFDKLKPFSHQTNEQAFAGSSGKSQSSSG